MNTSSAKDKGQRLAKRVAELIRLLFGLAEDDVYNTPSGVQGEDVKLSPLARKYFPFSIECKNVEKLNIWAALKQAESQNRKYKPLLVFSRNYSKDYCALKLEDLMHMLKQIKDLEQEVIELHEEKAGIDL